MKERLAVLGLEMVGSTPEECAAVQRNDIAPMHNGTGFAKGHVKVGGRVAGTPNKVKKASTERHVRIIAAQCKLRENSKFTPNDTEFG